VLSHAKGEAPMSKRLPGYDYSQPGFYFVTMCTQHHRLMFGTTGDGQVYLKGPVFERLGSICSTAPSAVGTVMLSIVLSKT